VAGARGTLFLVVGPSGVGKDTLIAGAAAALAGDPRFHFARRVITRPAEAGGEAHEPATPERFAAAEAAGRFALAWSAHGRRYGIDAAAVAATGDGIHVIASVSRQVIDEARTRFPPVRVIAITAPPDLIARRLAARGRESAVEIAGRLDRAVLPVGGADVIRIDNSGPAEDAIGRFVAVLTQA
jgi:phosphonate metabolism protein PhnN/1,5-bisphosphokinase (PRPP-forming)